MIKMMTCFPRSVSFGVTDMDRPTVPKADTTSKTISINVRSSDTVRIKTAVMTNRRLATVIARAFTMYFG